MATVKNIYLKKKVGEEPLVQKQTDKALKRFLFLVASFIKTTSIGVIGLYQKFISPILGRNCRFIPSCSEYSKGVLQNQKLHKAIFFIFFRIIRCHPFHKGGADPIPQRKKRKR